METRFNVYFASVGAFIPNWLLVRTEISPGAKLTYVRLAQKVNAKGVARSHVAKLAAHLGTEIKQVIFFLFELEKQKLIKIRDPLIGPGTLSCFLPNHPWMGYTESDQEHSSDSTMASKVQTKSNGHSRSGRSNGHLNKSKQEGSTSGNGKADGHQMRQPLSRFTYEECLDHTVKKRESGELIRSVRALANHFYWTGTEDEEITKRLAANDTDDD